MLRASLSLDLDKSSVKAIQPLNTDKLRSRLEKETGRSFNDEQAAYIVELLDITNDGILDNADWIYKDIFPSRSVERSRKRS